MDKTYKIYLLDDCESTSFIIKKWLSPELQVETFHTPNDFIEKFNKAKPDLGILDVNLNDNRSGLDVLQEIQNQGKKNIPFIVISQEDPEFRRSNAYELGAVDYIKKPLDKNEFKLKISNILNLIYYDENAHNTDELISLDEKNLCFSVNGKLEHKVVRLTPKEFIILKQLIANKHAIVSREQILARLENTLNEKFVMDRVVDVHVCNIKKKLGPYKKVINSVYGVGYKYNPDTEIA